MDNNNKNNNILFPNQTIIKTKYFEVAQDWEVPIVGFFIVSPLRKVKSISEFSDEEAIDFITTTKKVRHAMQQALNIKEVYLFQNEDSQHGFHLWIFPRHEWMESFGRKIQSVKPIMLHAEEKMCDEQTIQNVKDAVTKVKQYLENTQ